MWFCGIISDHENKLTKYVFSTDLPTALNFALICISRVDKRTKYSRRRPFSHDADVDYINERNMKFNKKASRFYDKYTAEIKQNLERGTAV